MTGLACRRALQQRLCSFASLSVILSTWRHRRCAKPVNFGLTVVVQCFLCLIAFFKLGNVVGINGWWQHVIASLHVDGLMVEQFACNLLLRLLQRLDHHGTLCPQIPRQKGRQKSWLWCVRSTSSIKNHQKHNKNNHEQQTMIYSI